MSKFYNPYHFVPVVDRKEHKEDITVEDFKKDKPELKQATHDRYFSEKEKIHSGRLICRLTTEGPIFIGSERIKGTPAEVEPFELESGIPALPASSLRGMISSIAEAASNSALRVLDKTHYSRRMEAREGNEVNNLGILLMEGDVLKLLPLEGKATKGEYEKVPYSDPPMLRLKTGSFLDNASLKSHSPDNREYWYQDINTYKLINQAEYQTLTDDQRVNYKRGILRILGIDGREKNIPASKKYEYFIPYPEGIENNPKLNAQDAVDKFQKLADARTVVGSQFPFELKGSERNDNHEKHGNKIRLREGDVVFYRPDSTGKNVEEVMISSIWRREAGGSSYDFFEKISKELLPFNLEREKKREKITIAEQMFGFVEKRDNENGQSDDSKQESGLALAGRLRFSFGKLSSTIAAPFYNDPVLLKILDSPKPPSPTLYFKHKHKNKNNSNEYIGKKMLNLNAHIPQGRKFYLHHNDIDKKPWETKHDGVDDNLKQKSRITPIKKDSVFYFHIDFNNLSEQELGLLCYAVRPTEKFRHKLGMGKPLGLGQVRIDPIGLFFIDRFERYNNTTDLFNAKRYHEYWVPEDENVAVWPEEYQKEQWEAQNGLKKSKKGFLNKKDGIYNTQNAFEPQSDIKTALELLGNPESTKNKKVHYPQIVENPDLEEEHFQWFGENEKLIDKKEKQKNNHQPHKHIEPEHLEPLNKDSEHLLSLNKLEKTE